MGAERGSSTTACIRGLRFRLKSLYKYELELTSSKSGQYAVQKIVRLVRETCLKRILPFGLFGDQGLGIESIARAMGANRGSSTTAWLVLSVTAVPFACRWFGV